MPVRMDLPTVHPTGGHPEMLKCLAEATKKQTTGNRRQSSDLSPYMFLIQVISLCYTGKVAFATSLGFRLGDGEHDTRDISECRGFKDCLYEITWNLRIVLMHCRRVARFDLSQASVQVCQGRDRILCQVAESFCLKSSKY